MQKFLPLFGRRRRPELADPKPTTVRFIAPDGQYLEVKLGPGDAIGYAGIRADVDHDGRLILSHYLD